MNADNMRVLGNIKTNIENLIEGQKKILTTDQSIQHPGDYEYRFGQDHVVFKLMGEPKDTTKNSGNPKIDRIASKIKAKENYEELFNNPLIVRKDIFDFISINCVSSVEDQKELNTLFTNNPTFGELYYTRDSVINVFESKKIFQLDLGLAEYQAYNTLLCKSRDGAVYLTGLVNMEKFEDQKREVSAHTISIAVILTIIILLALPIIKLFVMSNMERLYTKDVLFTGASVTVIPMGIILLFMYLTTQLKDDKNEARENLVALNDQVDQNFEGEISSVMDVLNDIDSITTQEWKNKNDSIHNVFNWIKGFNRPESSAFFYSLYQKDRRDAFSKSIGDTTVYRDSEKGNYWSFGGLRYPDFNLKQGHRFQYFNSIFWCSPDGKIRIYISSEGNPDKVTDLSHRKYIMKVANKETRLYKREQPLFMESIRSVSDGNYEIGIGIPSGIDSLPVLAASFSSASLIDPFVKPGYGFCLMDKSGKTLFHSEKERNLNENFLEETGGKFTPFVSSDRPQFASADYQGKSHYVYLSKLDCIDGYYLATFQDKEYVNTANSMTIMLTLEMQVAFLLVLFLQGMLLSLLSTKPSNLKQKVFAFNWLRPYCSDDHQYNRAYLCLFMINALAGFYCFVESILHADFDDFVIHDLMLVGICVVGINYYVLSNLLPPSKKMYTRFGKPSHNRFLKISFGVILGVLMIGKLILMGHAKDLKAFGSLVLLGLLAIGIYKILIMIPLQKESGKGDIGTRNYIGHKGAQLLKKYEMRPMLKAYQLFTFSLICLITVIPSFIFYSISYNKEREILHKYYSYDLTSQYASWFQNKASQYYDMTHPKKKPRVPNPEKFVATMVNEDTFFHSTLSDLLLDSVKYTAGADLGHVDSLSQDYIYYLLIGGVYGDMRIAFNPYGLASKGYLSHTDWDLGWKYEADTFTYYGPDKKYIVAGAPKRFSEFFIDNVAMMVLVLVPLLVAVIFFLLSGTSRKICGLAFKGYVDHLIPNFDQPAKIHKHDLVKIYQEADLWRLKYDKGIGKDSFNNTFLVGVNASCVRKVYQQLEHEYPSTLYTMDMIDLPHVLKNQASENTSGESPAGTIYHFRNSKLGLDVALDEIIKSPVSTYTALETVLRNSVEGKGLHEQKISENDKDLPKLPLLIYIEHFEFSFDDMDLNRIKVHILQQMVHNPLIRVVISSNISPIKIYEHYEDQINHFSTDPGAKAEEAYEKMMALKMDYRNWLNVLGGFYRINVPFDTTQIDWSRGDKRSPQYDVMKGEFEHGKYLNQLFFNRRLYKGCDNEEDVILHVQETSYTYYYSIWNNLSKEERYIVYDIARDKFVNTNNVDGIIDLLHKGILVFDHSLRLMNESFGNFVLSKVSSDEALARELESKQKGTWNITFAVLILVVIGLLVFISFGRIHVLSEINTIIASAGAAMTLLVRLGGLFAISKVVK
ncbi:PDC sensor domain-containing protein [Echinicola rosea]|nr:cache domain-containing protein [Echinicola rosea]